MLKRKLKFILIHVLLLTVISSALYVHASEIMPCYNNVLSTKSTATLSSSGQLTIKNSYEGIEDITTKAVITTYIEKKFLIFFWTKVDIGTSNNEWIDTIYNYTYSGSHSTQLSSTGTYRVTVNYVIYGSNGEADEITETIEKEY